MIQGHIILDYVKKVVSSDEELQPSCEKEVKCPYCQTENKQWVKCSKCGEIVIGEPECYENNFPCEYWKCNGCNYVVK